MNSSPAKFPRNNFEFLHAGGGGPAPHSSSDHALKDHLPLALTDGSIPGGPIPSSSCSRLQTIVSPTSGTRQVVIFPLTDDGTERFTRSKVESTTVRILQQKVITVNKDGKVLSCIDRPAVVEAETFTTHGTPEQVRDYVNQKIQLSQQDWESRTGVSGSEGVAGAPGGGSSDPTSPVPPIITTSSNLSIKDLAEQDVEIERVLRQTQDTFDKILTQHRDEFVKMFPAFRNLRQSTTLYSCHTSGSQSGGSFKVSRQVVTATAQRMETVNKSHSSGAGFSSPPFLSPTSDENSLVTRAFLQYQGPGGYKISVESGKKDDDQHSEPESDEDVRSLAPSELGESETGIVKIDQGTGKSSLVAFARTRDPLEKARLAVQELAITENNYVEKLHLLDQIFRLRVTEAAKTIKMPDKDLRHLFSNMEVLYKMHSNLLLEIEERFQNWHNNQKIADVLYKFAPFFKCYAEYTTNYATACSTFKRYMKLSKQFSIIVEEIQKRKECDNLPLETHFICPVQRVTRYQLLIQEYLKNLPNGHQDLRDGEAAKQELIQAASHANETMRQLDKYKHVVEVQDLIGGELCIVTPGRELVKQGKVMKISQRTGQHEPRYLFLFSDLLLVCAERGMIGKGKYKVTAMLDIKGLQVLEGDNLETENTFYVRNRQTCLELYTSSASEKHEWQQALWNTVREQIDRVKTLRNSALIEDCEDQNNFTNSQCCSFCSGLFSAKNKQYVCKECQTLVCKKCAAKKKLLMPSCDKPVRLCVPCYDKRADKQENNKQKQFKLVQRKSERRSNVDQTAVKTDDPSIFDGYLNMKTTTTGKWLRRYFAIHENFVLYSFKHGEKGCCTTASLPLPGCEISLPMKQDISVTGRDELVFKLVHPSRTYYFQAANQESMAKWMAVLDLASKAEMVMET